MSQSTSGDRRSSGVVGVRPGSSPMVPRTCRGEASSMSSTALDDQRFERVAPTWEVGRPAPEDPTPSRPSDRGVRITVAVAVVLTVITTTLAAGAIVAGFAFGLPMSGGVGQRSPHPQSAPAPPNGFELPAAQMRRALRAAPSPAGTTRTKVDVGFGEATVIVPRGVEVVVDGRVVAGQVESFGRAED